MDLTFLKEDINLFNFNVSNRFNKEGARVPFH